MNKPRPIDYELVKTLAGIGCTDREIAAATKFCYEWICKRKKTDAKLKEAIDDGRENGKATLRRMQWKAASDGNPTMLIWLGKQMLSQKDRQELSTPEGEGGLNIQVVFKKVKDKNEKQKK